VWWKTDRQVLWDLTLLVRFRCYATKRLGCVLISNRYAISSMHLVASQPAGVALSTIVHDPVEIERREMEERQQKKERKRRKQKAEIPLRPSSCGWSRSSTTTSHEYQPAMPAVLSPLADSSADQPAGEQLQTKPGRIMDSCF
jgi:hypothetical protein